MKVAERAKEFYDRAFTASEDLAEPYRNREQRLMNAMKTVNKIALGVGVAFGAGELALNLVNQPEVADQITDSVAVFAGSYAVAGAGYAVGLHVVEYQNDRDQEVAQRRHIC